MVVNELVIALIISLTVIIPNTYITKTLAKSQIRNMRSFINVMGKIMVKTLFVTIASAIIFTLPVLLFTNSDPGTAVAIVAVWLTELLSFTFCLFLTPIQLVIRKGRWQ
jgi:hypothetical protein